MQRAKRIASIKSDAKKAAIEARLDNNQSALLKIAKGKGAKAQIRAISGLSKKTANAEGERSIKKDESPKAGRNSHEHGRREEKESVPETTIEQLTALWREHFLNTSWGANDSCYARGFYQDDQALTSQARIDVVEFVQNVFLGREKSSRMILYALAERQGFSKKQVRKVLRGVMYKQKKQPRSEGKRWFYLNRNKDWKEEIPVVTVAELRQRPSNVDHHPHTVTRGDAVNTEDEVVVHHQEIAEDAPSAPTVNILDDYFTF